MSRNPFITRDTVLVGVVKMIQCEGVTSPYALVEAEFHQPGYEKGQAVRVKFYLADWKEETSVKVGDLVRLTSLVFPADDSEPIRATSVKYEPTVPVIGEMNYFFAENLIVLPEPITIEMHDIVDRKMANFIGRLRSQPKKLTQFLSMVYRYWKALVCAEIAKDADFVKRVAEWENCICKTAWIPPKFWDSLRFTYSHNQISGTLKCEWVDRNLGGVLELITINGPADEIKAIYDELVRSLDLETEESAG